MAEKTAEEKQQEALDKQQHLDECHVAGIALENHIGRLVSFRDDGERHGYLVKLHKNFDGIYNSVIVQPIGTFGKKPAEIVLSPTVVLVDNSPTKYPTLETYAAANGWNEKKKTVLLVAGGPTHQAINIAVQQAVAEQQKVKMLETVEASPGPGDMVLVHDEIMLGHVIEKELPKEIINGTLATAEEIGLNKPEWNPERVVELFKGGMKVVDIAVDMGYARGSGQNRTRAALRKAGLIV